MINITCGLMCLLVFVFVVHMMVKLLGPRHWGKQHLKRRYYEDQVKSKKQSVACGLSGAPGTVAQRLVPGGTMERRPRTVRCDIRSARCKKMERRPRTVRCDIRSARCKKPAHQRSSAVSDQRLGAPDSEQCTVRCTTGLSRVPQRAQFFSNG
jgi:hypothetical protein